MANRLISNPFIIDTASNTPIWLPNIKVTQFEFYPTQAADTVVVNDKDGNLIWSASGNADNETVRSGKVEWVRGLTVPTLSAGAKLAIFFC